VIMTPSCHRALAARRWGWLSGHGYQTADYVDEQKDAPTPRKGRFLGKGCISLQGHDPTTNMSFRHIRLAELPKGPAKKAESK